jgi:hypothetical protein
MKLETILNALELAYYHNRHRQYRAALAAVGE